LGKYAFPEVKIKPVKPLGELSFKQGFTLVVESFKPQGAPREHKG